MLKGLQERRKADLALAHDWFRARGLLVEKAESGQVAAVLSWLTSPESWGPFTRVLLRLDNSRLPALAGPLHRSAGSSAARAELPPPNGGAPGRG